MNKKADEFFELTKRGGNLKTEILAGTTTFATLAYVLIVHTGMMVDAGMDGMGVMLAVALISGLITIAMGIYGRVPFALAPGMGGNAILAYTLVLGGVCTWQVGMGMIMISGIVFLLLSIFSIREKIVEIIPKPLKIGIGAAVGLFLIRLSLVNSGLVGPNFSGFGDFSNPSILLAAIGMAITLVLYCLRFRINGRTYVLRGSLLISIVLTTVVGILMGVVSLPESIMTTGGFASLKNVTFKLDVLGALKPQYFAYILIFFMGDFFSTLGTALGLGGKAHMLDENGNLPVIGKVFLVDAVGTCVGALFGLTTITTYVESAAGVEVGGRTGLTAITTGLLFLICMFFAPVFLMIPTAATAPALIMVGISMLQTLSDADFEISEWIPVAIMLIIAMFVSLGAAIAIGLLSFCIIRYGKYLFTNERSKATLPSIATVIMTLLSLLQFIPTSAS
jgi:AGZA family xanthine/uracil permease-like MFS transporter